MNDKCSLVTRRQFLLGLGATVVTAACSGKSVTVFTQDPATAPPSSLLAPATLPAGTLPPPPAADRTLVVVEMGGGNDGWSTVVPHAVSRYYDLRPNTAIENPIDLDGEVGLHPALATVAEQYQAGTVAIVEGIGMPKPDLSHFVSMRRWWDGAEMPSHTGWLGRYLDGTSGFDDLLAGITVGPGPSQAMLGNASFVVNIADTSGLASEMPWWIDDADELMGAWAGFAPVDVPVSELTPLQRAISGTVEARRELEAGLRPIREALEGSEDDEDQYTFGGQLRLAASLITAGIGPKVIYVQGEGDFDTHENQRDGHDQLMAGLDGGLAAFWSELDRAGMTERAVVMTASEFGRRPEDNGGGTEHGTASSHLVMGPAVAGGRYGEAPSWTRFDPEGNAIHTVDYRSLYATALEGWLGAPHVDVLQGEYEVLPLFTA